MLYLKTCRGKSELCQILCVFIYDTEVRWQYKTVSMRFWCVNTRVCVFMFFTLEIKCHGLKPAKAIPSCKYSVLCRGYIGAMFAFVAIATDVRPSQITSGTQWLMPSYSPHAHSAHTWQNKYTCILHIVCFRHISTTMTMRILKTIHQLHPSFVFVRWENTRQKM